MDGLVAYNRRGRGNDNLMLKSAIIVVALVLAAGSANGQDVSVSCVGGCSPAWDTSYELRIDGAPRDSLLGLTIKSCSLADGRTRPGDTCIGSFSPTVPASQWPDHTGGAKGRRKNNFRFSLHGFDGVVPFGH